jgi:hypothetical protein
MRSSAKRKPGENHIFNAFISGAIFCALLLIAPVSAMAVSFQVPGGDTTLDVGGYIKLDAIYNDVTAGDNSQANIELVPGAIPIEGTTDGEENQIVFNGRESRLWVKTNTPTDLGPLKTHLEFDFDTNDGNQVVSNSWHARIRHAYGTLGNFLFGRTWSLFMHLESLPEINDFGGPTGQIFVRQAQVRYTIPLGTMNVQIGLENPETYVTDGISPIAAVDDDANPDIIGRFNYNADWGNLSAAAMLRQLTVDEGDEADDVDDSDMAVAGQVGGVLKLFAKDSLMGVVSYGKGIGRYSSLAAHADAVITADGDVEAINLLSGFIGYQHYWIDTWRSSLVIGYTSAEEPDTLEDSAMTESTTSVHANLFMDPVKSMRVGVEYIYGRRELYNGDDGELNRIQFSAKVTF